ncbi:MAG TPA: hypothetical protein VN255_13040, partial [Mycobacterium sp.]|nr:hypothetical protein [Mycobacterium sp.]
MGTKTSRVCGLFAATAAIIALLSAPTAAADPVADHDCDVMPPGPTCVAPSAGPCLPKVASAPGVQVPATQDP